MKAVPISTGDLETQTDTPPVDLKPGDSASFTKTITQADVVLFAGISGDSNPVHLDAEYASKSRFGRRIAHGMLTASFLSTVMGTKLPGAGAVYVGQTLRFVKPVFVGDTITAVATVDSYDSTRGRLKMATTCVNQHGEDVITGDADILYRRPAEETA